jgi:hypothetical protein
VLMTQAAATEHGSSAMVSARIESLDKSYCLRSGWCECRHGSQVAQGDHRALNPSGDSGFLKGCSSGAQTAQLTDPTPVGRQILARRTIGDAYAVLDVFWLVLTTVQAVVRSRQDLVLENLLLRHQLAVLTQPTRRRSHTRLRL